MLGTALLVIKTCCGPTQGTHMPWCFLIREGNVSQESHTPMHSALANNWLCTRAVRPSHNDSGCNCPETSACSLPMQKSSGQSTVVA